MRAMMTGLVLAGLAMGASGAFAQSAGTPTPATPGPNPGAAATDRILDPAKPTPVVPGPSTAPTPPPAPPAERSPAPERPVPPRASLDGEGREMVAALRDIAKATRENVDYNRVVPDILTQILTKLDKIEIKLDRMETATARRR